MVNRNVTITLDEETARWARIEAARQDTSISKFVGCLLRESMQGSHAYDAAMTSYMSRKPEALKGRRRYPHRDEIHDRAGLR